MTDSFTLLPLVIGLALVAPVCAAPTSEEASLTLMQNQLDQLELTLLRAQAQASKSANARFFFDYAQAHTDIQTIRTGIDQYLTPERAQPRTLLPLPGLYRREDASQ